MNISSSAASAFDCATDSNHESNQFIEAIEEFFLLTSRILARQVLRISITIEPSQNNKQCAKFTITDDTKKHASFSRPMFDNVAYLLHKHANAIASPVSSLAAYLLQVFDEIQTKNVQLNFLYKKGVLHSVDVIFSKNQENSWEYTMPLYRIGFKNALTKPNTKFDVAQISRASQRILAQALEGENDPSKTAIQHPDLPLDSMKYHHFVYKENMPEITIESCRRYVRHMNSILQQGCIPVILILAQTLSTNYSANEADIIWGESIANIRAPSNVLHLYTENGEKISCIVLANTELKKGYIVYFERMPSLFAM